MSATDALIPAQTLYTPPHCTFLPEDWHRLSQFWYPIALERDLSDEKPLKATLLDEQLVIYRINGEVVVAKDLCPHRGVPLSLGKMCNSGLVCPYHGLLFGEQGKCKQIPSSPSQIIPNKLHLTSFAAQVRYGLIWTRLAQDGQSDSVPLPVMPHWEDSEFQQIVCPTFDVAGFAGRQVEGFLDVAHFAWIHTDTFADPGNQEVPNYTTTETPYGFYADYYSTVGNYPATSQYRAPEGFQWLRHFEMSLPFTATLTIHFPDNGRLVIMNAASPVSARQTRLFAPIARNFDKHIPVQDVYDFNLRVFEEDREMVETQRPERLPVDMTLEAHIPADKSSIAYRRGLQRLGFGEFFLV